MSDKEEYSPGVDCVCSAYGESECGCGADWTPKEVYELRKRLDSALTIAGELIAMIRTNAMRGVFSGVSIEDLNDHLKLWENRLWEIKNNKQLR